MKGVDSVTPPPASAPATVDSLTRLLSHSLARSLTMRGGHCPEYFSAFAFTPSTSSQNVQLWRVKGSIPMTVGPQGFPRSDGRGSARLTLSRESFGGVGVHSLTPSLSHSLTLSRVHFTGRAAWRRNRATRNKARTTPWMVV